MNQQNGLNVVTEEKEIIANLRRKKKDNETVQFNGVLTLKSINVLPILITHSGL